MSLLAVLIPACASSSPAFPMMYSPDLPCGSDGKASAYNAGDLGSIPGSGRSSGEPSPVLLPGKSHGWRSLVGYSTWGRKESDMTKQRPFTSQG